MVRSYSGPLFQLALAASTSTRLDIGQDANGVTDMTTWSAFCGGVASNCLVSKIYAQINGHGNDLVASTVDHSPPTCSHYALQCAAPFTIEAATGLPIINTINGQEYTLANDAVMVGMSAAPPGAGAAHTVIINGQDHFQQEWGCCGMFGLAHYYAAYDAAGTDFMIALQWGAQYGGGMWNNCLPVGDVYCVITDEEAQGHGQLYCTQATHPLNLVVLISYDPTTKLVKSIINGALIISEINTMAEINPPGQIHLGGGGDLSQPARATLREMIVTNTTMSAADEAAIRGNMTAFYSMLTFATVTAGIGPWGGSHC